MPRQAKYVKQEAKQVPKEFADALRAIEAEMAEWNEVGRQTRLTYERNYAVLKEGWDMGLARKQTRYVMRASGLYCMRKRLKQIMREAKTLLKNGITGREDHFERNRLYAEKVAEAAKFLGDIEKFKAKKWNEVDDPGAHYHEKSHKKSAATDLELDKFFHALEGSQFERAFQVMEFTGARPQELAKGIRLELLKSKGKLTLRFTVEGVKCDGKKKGLEVRAVEVPFPENASLSTQKRWHSLAHFAKKGAVVKVDPTDKQPVGVRITQIAKNNAEKAGVRISSYSVRHRFSAQTKQSSGGDAVAVALALGHQSTKTQEHYARARRGGKDVSPVHITAIDLNIAEIRGPKMKTGPGPHTHEKVELNRIVGKNLNVSPPRPNLRI